MADLHGVQVNEKLQDSLYRLLTTLDGYVKEKDFYTVLEEGEEGKLLNSLKKATWHDFLDEKKRAGAKKRKAEVIPFSQLSEYQGNGAEDLPLDEVVSRVAERQPDAALDSVEAKLTLEQLSGVPGLTDRERQALLLEIALVEENGELPTYEGLGKAMGVTKGAAKKLLDRAFKKLRRYVLQD
jgi:DNA-directed RNA polymerase specialized sigma24 family protein